MRYISAMRSLLFCSFLVFASCKTDKHETASSATASASSDPSSPASVSADKTGVGECDSYFAAVRSCMTKVSDDKKKKELADSANTMRTNLERADKGASPFYATACQSALDAVRADPACR